MRPTTRTVLVSALALALWGLAHAALASSDSGAGTCDPAHFCLEVQGFFILDFVVFFGGMIYVGRRPIAAMLDKRHQDVAKDIQAAQELKAAAEARLHEYRQRIARLQDELERLLADARAGTQVEMDRILHDARTQVARVNAEERQRLEQESKKLRDQLEREAAALALQLAERIVRERLDASGHAHLVDRALGELSELPAGSRPAA